MNHCVSCAFWDQRPPGDTLEDGQGQCEILTDPEDYEKMATDPRATPSGHYDYGAWVVTRHDFGCVAWSQQTLKTDSERVTKRADQQRRYDDAIRKLNERQALLTATGSTFGTGYETGADDPPIVAVEVAPFDPTVPSLNESDP